MEDSLKLVLQAELDKATSLNNINKQIEQLSKGLEKLNVKINFDDNVLRDLNSQIKEITKDLTKSNDVSVKINTSKLEKAKSIFKDIEGELINFKEKVSFDKEGNQITKLVSQFKLLDGTIKTITQGSSGRIINEQSEKNLQKIQNDREKALQQEQKIRENITKQEQQSLAQMQKQYQTTLDLFNTLKNDSKNLFKVSGDRNDLEKYINQLASIKVQLSDMQKGKLSITDSKTTQEIQKQLSLMEQEFNRQKSVIDLARQKEQILTQINTKLKEIQGLRSNTADSGEIERLNKIEQSLKGVKTNATDANSQLKLINAEIKNFKIDAKQSEAFKKLAFDIEQFQKNTKSKLQNLFDLGRIDSSQLNKFLGQVNSLSTSTPNARQEMIALRNEITNVARNANTGATGIQKFAKNVLQLAGISSVYTVMQSLVGITKELTSNVMELDSAMISLQRVSSGTTSTYEEFKNNMFQVADSVGSTATNMINSAKEFSQLGYSLEESGKLAETASKLATAGEMSIDEATKNLTASLTAFNMEVADSEKIADIYNKMGNVMSVTSSDVGQALQRSANALAQANNSLEESVALIATANRSIQNSERVGTALKTISMRIRGVSEDGEVLDEKLGEIVEKYTGVKIFDEATQEFKSTYQIVLELSKVWSTLSDKQQALLAEKLSGKQNAEVFLAMLNNSKDLVKGLEEAQNALGTTEEEMAIVMTSYEAKVNQLKNAWLELGQTLINSEFVKGLIDGLTNLVQGITTLVDNLDRVKPVLGTILVLITSIKAQNILASITSSVSGIKTLGTSLGSLVGLLGNATTGAMSFSSVLSALNLNPVVLGITALAGSLLYFKNKADEARIAEEQLDQQRTQKLNTLKEEVSSTENVRKSYDEINESTMTRAEKARELTKLQLDLINTYGAEANGIDLINGNYNQNIGILDELIRKKKEYLAQELGDKNEDLSLDAMNARTMGGDFSKGEIYHVDDTQAEELDLITEQLNEMYDNAKISSTALDDLFGKKRTISFVGDINESLEMMKVMKEMMKGTSLEGTDLYDALTDGISKMSDIAMEYNSNELERLKIQSDLIASEAMRQAGIEDLNDATDEQISKCSNYINSLSDVDKKTKDFALSLLGISTASDADGIETITAKLNGLKKSSEECEQAVGEIETAMADLTGILEDLDAGNGITSGSLKKIISNYPDLLQYMNDEGELREQLQKKMEDYSDQYKNAMRDLMSANEQFYDEDNARSEDYYREKILQNQTTCTELENDLKDLYEALGVMYEVDLEEYKTVDQLKAGVTEELINSLYKAWSEYFTNVGNKFKQMSNLNKLYNNPWVNSSMKRAGYDHEEILDEAFRQSEGVARTAPDELKKIMEDIEKQKSEVNDAVADALGKFTFDPVSIPVGGAKSASKSKNKKGKKETEKYASYVDSLYSSIIESYENNSKKLAQEIEVASKRIENAQTKNGLGLDENALIEGSLDVNKMWENASSLFESDSDFSILEKKYSDASTAIAKHSENLRNLRKQIVSELSSKNYSELKGIDLQNIQQFQVDKIVYNLERQIENAEVASNEKLKASLEYKKDLIEDYAGNIIDINEKVNNLASDYQDAMSDYANAVIDNINKVYDGVDSVINRQLTQLETMQEYLRGSDDEGWLSNQSQQIDMVSALEQTQLKRIQEYKKQGYDEDSELMQQAYDTYYSYYQKRLALVKEEGEKRIEMEKEAQEKLKKQYEDDQEAIETLLDLTLKMLKQNINDQIDALEERKDATLKNIKEEQEAYEEAIDKEIDMYRRLIEAKKEALNQEFDEYTYNKDVEKATKEISVLENKIETLSKDSSAKAQAQIAQYKEQLEEAREALYELQYEHSIEEQERALDKELDDYEALKESEKEAHVDYLEDKYDSTEEEFDKEIDALKRQLEEEGRLRQQAIALIESKSQDFYNQLLEWNDVYNTGVREDITRAWDNCYNALENYNNGQLDVSATLDTIISQLEQCENIIESLDNADWQDYVNTDTMSQDYVSDKLAKDEPSNSSSVSNNNSSSNKKRTERENMQEYYHNTMLEAQKTGNKQLENWVKSERKKNGFDAESGKDLKKFHVGLDNGRVGDGLKPDEIIAKLTKSEWVLTSNQMQNLTDNVKTLVNNNNPSPQITLQVDSLMKDVTITKDVDADSLLVKMKDGLLNIVTKELSKSMNLKFGW